LIALGEHLPRFVHPIDPSYDRHVTEQVQAAEIELRVQRRQVEGSRGRHWQEVFDRFSRETTA